jgi:predicted transcriptional regulator
VKAQRLIQGLSRRERQIMDVIYRAGRATALEVQGAIPDPPSYSAVRAHLKVLEEKGHLRHQQDGTRHVFVPTVPASQARGAALKHLVRTFFDGSTSKAVAALLDLEKDRLGDHELERLSQLIELARKEGR